MRVIRLLVNVLLVLVIAGSIAGPAMATSTNQAISSKNLVNDLAAKCIKTGTCSMGSYTPNKRQIVSELERLLSERRSVQVASIDHSGSDSSSKSAHVSVGDGGNIHLDSKLYASWHLDNPLSKDEVTCRRCVHI